MNISKLKVFSTAVFATLLSAVWGQTIDTLEIDGKEYFVYPFKIDVETQSDYNFCIKKKRYGAVSYSDYLGAYDDYFGPKMSRSEFKKIMRRSGMRSYSFESKSDYVTRKFIKAVRNNPYPLLEQTYSFDHEIIPSLDPIPDGDYVQLFESFCMVQKSGDCFYEDERVAAHFTLKDNLLEGYACWLNVHGDTLLAGNYINGLKDGEWVLEERNLGYSIGEKNAKNYIENGYPDMDTTRIYQTFLKGSGNGKYRLYENSEFPTEEGHYTDGVRTGSWSYRDILYKKERFKKVRQYRNDVVTRSYTLLKDDTNVVRKPWIRDGYISTYDHDYLEFDFYSEYSKPYLPSLYRINFEREENYELDEEDYNSYGGDEYGDYDLGRLEYSGEYYDEPSSRDYSLSANSVRIYDYKTDRYFSRGHLIDSLGAVARYTGRYEARYPNNQICFSYEFVDGSLVEEDTIFWPNGEAHDVILFVADSNHYSRSIYDLNGKLYKRIIYDSLGDYYRTDFRVIKNNTVILEGLEAYFNDYSKSYTYSGYDTLRHELTDQTVLFRKWMMIDSSRMTNIEYDPRTNTLTREYHSILSNLSTYVKRTFAEDFTNWTGKFTRNLGGLELIKTSSGSLYEYEMEDDTLPQMHVENSYRDYDVTDDYELKMNGTKYTGPVAFSFGKGSLKLPKNKMTIHFGDDNKSSKKWEKAYNKYWLKGKVKYPDLMAYFEKHEENVNPGERVYDEFFDQLLSGKFDYPNSYGGYNYDYYDYGYGGRNNRSQNNAAKLTKIDGNMVDGKPNGLWVGYDQFNKKMIEVPYLNGEVHGQVIEYNYEFPLDKDEDLWYYEDQMRDSLPAKKTYYISRTAEYKNGIRNGKEISYSWMNEVLSESNYEDGFLHGRSIERNKLAYSISNYENGDLDGYVQTYLTLKDRDSILLFDLNFQDGALQGESKSYHLNGNLAKRGFFLNGEPIEDYEAYDSLGFRYHYVKFKYSFPVEEKLWEENELSVRYLFNWEDSIRFSPDDITTSQSLESLLYKLGFGRYNLNMPYYGRPTLVNKRGVEFHMTKYYPNDTIARDGDLEKGKKIGLWKFYNYDGEMLYEVVYKDSIIEINDSIKFKSKGILSDFDADGNLLYTAHIIEKFEKYDCSHTDHYEIRQLATIWQSHDSLKRMNGYVKNYYDNGVLQNEGQMKNGLPDGIWKSYDPFGKLNHVGVYVMGKRDGRWISGDLSKTKYLGDICLNPNMPDLENEIKWRENQLDITISNYKMGKALNRQYYDLDMNRFIDEEETEAVAEEEEEN